MQWSRILLLALLLLRAYIPAGYMPVAGSPFQLELCPGHHHVHGGPAQGSPTQGGHPAQAEDCPFGSAPVAGPVLHNLAFAPAMAARVIASLPTNALPPAKPSQRAHSPRAPPPTSSV